MHGRRCPNDCAPELRNAILMDLGRLLNQTGSFESYLGKPIHFSSNKKSPTACAEAFSDPFRGGRFSRVSAGTCEHLPAAHSSTFRSRAAEAGVRDELMGLRSKHRILTAKSPTFSVYTDPYLTPGCARQGREEPGECEGRYT